MILTAVRLGGRPGLPLLVLGPADGAAVAAQWGAVARLLGDDLQVVGWDLPGQGHNRGPLEHEPTVAEFAHDVLALVDEMSDSFDPVSFHYAGTGVGAAVGEEIRRTASKRVLSLTVVESVADVVDVARLIREAALGPPELSAQEHLDRRVLAYYGEEFDEGDRLVGRSGQGRLEFERTQQFVRARVAPGSRVIDIGGGTGVHAASLAQAGYRVHLVDPVPSHVVAADAHESVSAVLGDARSLAVADDAFDAALLLGPLYHLASREDRLGAWRETLRVVRPGGWVFGSAVSRLSALAWVTVIGPSLARAESGAGAEVEPIPERLRLMIEEGAGELGPTGFPGGHFHLADEFEAEARDAGLADVVVLGLEGPGAQAIEVSRSHDVALVDAARTLALAYESHPGLRDLSPHLLAMGRVPGG